MKQDVYEKYKDTDFTKAKRATSVPLLNRLRTEKSRITILIDMPVLTEFRARGEAQGIGYQTLINDALRQTFAKEGKALKRKAGGLRPRQAVQPRNGS